MHSSLPPRFPLQHLGSEADDGRVYVMLDIYKLQNQYLSLRERTRSIRSKTVSKAEAEGYELQEKQEALSTLTPAQSDAVSSSDKTEVTGEVVALRKEWRGWQLASLKNVYVLIISSRSRPSLVVME